MVGVGEAGRGSAWDLGGGEWGVVVCSAFRRGRAKSGCAGYVSLMMMICRYAMRPDGPCGWQGNCGGAFGSRPHGVVEILNNARNLLMLIARVWRESLCIVESGLRVKADVKIVLAVLSFTKLIIGFLNF